MLSSINLLGVRITSETEEKVLEYVLERLRKGTKKFFITTPNPEIIVYAKKHLDYLDKLNSSEIALPDGVGLMLASQIMAKPLKSRIAGTDFVEMLCEKSREKPVSMGFLGGKDGVAEKTAECLQKKYPWLNIVFVSSEWSARGPAELLSRPTSSHSLRALDGRPSPLVTPRSIDILFVAFGAPKQEEWIYENLEKLPVKAAMGVGGAFDYISGRVTRAPLFVRKLGLEWLFRLIRQPWRWKRQIKLIEFIYMVIKERLSVK